MTRSLILRLASVPRVFDGLRWILEGGYRGHQSVFQTELAVSRGPVLDIGCGTGIHAPRFPPDDYTGVDLNVDYVNWAATKWPGHRFQQGDAMQLPFGKSAFGTVLISGLLHHLSDEDALRVLAEASRVLKTDGLAVIWEDVPASRWNLPGHVIHRLDPGQWIRAPHRYRELIEQHFVIHTERPMRSGVMDYVVFTAAPGSGLSTIAAAVQCDASIQT